MALNICSSAGSSTVLRLVVVGTVWVSLKGEKTGLSPVVAGMIWVSFKSEKAGSMSPASGAESLPKMLGFQLSLLCLGSKPPSIGIPWLSDSAELSVDREWLAVPVPLARVWLPPAMLMTSVRPFLNRVAKSGSAPPSPPATHFVSYAIFSRHIFQFSEFLFILSKLALFPLITIVLA